MHAPPAAATRWHKLTGWHSLGRTRFMWPVVSQSVSQSVMLYIRMRSCLSCRAPQWGSVRCWSAQRTWCAWRVKGLLMSCTSSTSCTSSMVLTSFSLLLYHLCFSSVFYLLLTTHRPVFWLGFYTSRWLHFRWTYWNTLEHDELFHMNDSGGFVLRRKNEAQKELF